MLHRFQPALLLFLLTSALAAQPALQSPDEFLGRPLGAAFTEQYEVEAYVAHMAETMPNVIVEPYGESYQGRTLMTLVLSSPANMERIEEIRTDNLKRAGLLPGDPEGAPTAIVWLSYNVHGNEVVATESFLQTAYELADPTNERTQSWLENTVVILDPCLNPDGRERYVQWYKRTRGAVPNVNPDAREHREPWPGGRSNHYYFDLNRDWAWQVQQETQGRIERYHEWMPHVHVDFHEQGVNAPYYFAPAAEPFHAAITDWQREFQTTIGENHARYFDANNWLYFTREIFDLFYPSYGDTYPTFNGAIGMTYEQGGSGRAGLGIITAIGDTLTLADRILHHHTTGLSTVEATSADAERVVAEFEQYFDDAENRPEGPYRTFVVKATNSRAKLDTLRFYLARQRIQFGYADRQRRLTGFDYGRAMLRDVTVEPGDLVVSMYQPKGVLARVLFEPEAQLADSLTYDITAWALPYAYGLEAYALTDRIDPVVRALPEREQALPADAPPYAYAFAWDSFDALQTLTTLLRHHVRVRYAERPFEVEGNRYPAGSIIALRADNAALEARFDAAISEAAAQTGQLVRPVATGFVTEGADFGSSDVRFLDAPNVLLLAGQGVSSNATGEVWHYFDQQIGYPVTLIEPDRIDNVDLDDYDVIVLPSGAYGGILEAPVLEELRGWIRDGGRLIAIEGAASFLAGMDGFQLRRKPREAEAEDEDPEDLLVSYGDRERRRITERIPGSIYAVDLDPTHPLAYGYGETYFTLKRSTRDFAFLDGGWNVGVLRPDAYRSGFTGSKVFDDLDDTLVFGVQDLGRGHVIYMIDNPLFRGFWYEGKLLFGNAVFMVD